MFSNIHGRLVKNENFRNVRGQGRPQILIIGKMLLTILRFTLIPATNVSYEIN